MDFFDNYAKVHNELTDVTEKSGGAMEKNRTIVVKGVCKASVRPDWIVINLKLDSFCKAYDKAMALAQE